VGRWVGGAIAILGKEEKPKPHGCLVAHRNAQTTLASYESGKGEEESKEQSNQVCAKSNR
jgi:hypothetical protein